MDGIPNKRDSTNAHTKMRPVQLEDATPHANLPWWSSAKPRRYSIMTYEFGSSSETSACQSNSELVKVGGSSDRKGDRAKSRKKSRRETYTAVLPIRCDNDTRNPSSLLQPQTRSASSFNRDTPDHVSNAASSSCRISGVLCEADFISIFASVEAIEVYIRLLE